jgi:protein tyrosine/serine phosphatase
MISAKERKGMVAACLLSVIAWSSNQFGHGSVREAKFS